MVGVGRNGGGGGGVGAWLWMGSMERSWGGQGDGGGTGEQGLLSVNQNALRLYIWGLRSGTESSFLKGDH